MTGAFLATTAAIVFAVAVRDLRRERLDEEADQAVEDFRRMAREMREDAAAQRAQMHSAERGQAA